MAHAGEKIRLGLAGFFQLGRGLFLLFQHFEQSLLQVLFVRYVRIRGVIGPVPGTALVQAEIRAHPGIGAVAPKQPVLFDCEVLRNKTGPVFAAHSAVIRLGDIGKKVVEIGTLQFRGAVIRHDGVFRGPGDAQDAVHA